ncbi:MAG TPA: type II toxin-antitoxin system VapC family toxin [Chroococcidiopsis sp.]
MLDTHTLIWYFEDDTQLTSKAADILEDTSHDLYVSVASLWEIAIKLGLEKLSLKVSFQDFQGLLEQFSIKILPILFEDTVSYVMLPLHHRDPFDRILVAQSITHSLTLISRDVAFDAYPIQRVWA